VVVPGTPSGTACRATDVPTDVPPRVSSLRTTTDFSMLAASRQQANVGMQ